MGEIVVLDRHVLASPATAYDTAWATYGVTPGARSRAGRLEEEVPWGTHVTRAADPARLSGRAEAVLDPDNFDRLGQAVLPLGEWLAFSLWGAFGHDGGAGERRVVTHTLLFSPSELRRVRGHPEGLLRAGGRPAPWLRELAEATELLEPRDLGTVRVAVDGSAAEALEEDRLRELGRLRGVVLAAQGGDEVRLAAMLEGIYEALARSLAGEDLRHVVVRGVGAPTSTLLRLAWLGLPLEDRLVVSYVTEQRRTERPRAHLLGLPEAEWGRYVPDGSWVLGESEALSSAPGRAWWAELLASPDFPGGFREADRAAEARRWAVVGASDLDGPATLSRWRVRWSEEGPTVGGVRRLWEIESERVGGPRARAVGAALGAALEAASSGRDGADRALSSRVGDGAAGEGAALEEALTLLLTVRSGLAASMLRGAARTLRRRGAGERAMAALLRCRAAAAGVPSEVAELHRLIDAESDALRTLLSDVDGRGGLELVLAAAASAVGGARVAGELVRLGAAEARWTEAHARSLVEALAGRREGPETLAEVVAAVVREGHGAGVDVLAAEVVPRLDEAGVRWVLEAWAELPDDAARRATDVVAWRALARWTAAAGSNDDGLSAAVLERLGVARSPAEAPGAWRELVAAVSPAWLARGAVLPAFLGVLGAGRRPFGAGDEAGAELAGRLAAIVLARAGRTGLGEDRAGEVLRLLWTAGSDGALDALDPKAGPVVLSELLVHPAPVPLFHRIRERLVRALDEPPAARLPAEARSRLAGWAPALAARRDGDRPIRRLLVARGR